MNVTLFSDTTLHMFTHDIIKQKGVQIMEYGVLNESYQRIRNKDELVEIKSRLDSYVSLKDNSFIEEYLSISDSLRYVIEETNLNINLLTNIIYDTLHPLNEKDLYRWQRYARMKVKQLNIR